MREKQNNSICILNNTLNSGGAEKNCVIICNELVRREVDVELWVTKLSKSSLINLIDKNVQVRLIPGEKLRNSFFHLKKQMSDSTCRTLLIFNIELLIPAYFINKIFHLNYKIIARSISTLSLSFSKNGFLGRKLWLYFITYTLNRIDSIIAQSTGMKDDLVNNLKIQESKITIIPNPSFNFSGNSTRVHVNKVNIKEILFVGRLSQPKGLFYLLDAFKLALNSVSNLHLTIVGTGEMQEEILEKISELDIGNAISFEGYQTELIPYYKSAKATVLTSVREGFPNVLVESISVGTPVISFDCPSGPRDIVVPNVNGILVEHLNVTEFAKAIVDVVNENIKFDKQKVIESCDRFNLDTVIRKYEKILFE